jgi:acyl-CoA synthetase (AMP-forming)/AMP-acid ligase II
MFNSEPFVTYSDRILLKNKHCSLSYGYAYRAIMSWAYYLQQAAPRGNIALVMTNSLEAHILMLAAFQCHNVVMLNPDMLRVSPDLIQRLDIDHVVTFDFTLEVSAKRILIDQQRMLHHQVSPELYPEPAPGSLILVSSGTTGVARPVKFVSSEAQGFARSLLTKLHFTPEDCLYNVAPYYHGFGFLNIFTVIETGGSYYIPDTVDYKNIVNDINQTACTWVSSVPNLAKIMIKSAGTLHNRFRFAMAGGDTVGETLCSEFRSRFGVELLANYGFSDGGCVSVNTPSHHKDGSVGLVDPAVVKLGSDDEIFVYQTWLTSNEWLPTGDIGYIDSDGYLWIKARKKDIIKRQGKTIFPGELESHLEKVPGVVEIVAYRDGQNNKGDRIGIVYSGSITEAELKLYCTTGLPLDYHPNSILQLETIPRFNNKISRTWIKNYVDQL